MCVCVSLCVGVGVSGAISIAKHPVLPLYVEDGRCTNFLIIIIIIILVKTVSDFKSFESLDFTVSNGKQTV